MSIEDLQSQLTRNARTLLDDYLERVRQQVVVSAAENSYSVGSTTEISASDIARAIEDAELPNPSGRPMHLRLFQAYGVMFGATAVLAFVYFLVLRVGQTLTAAERIALLATIGSSIASAVWFWLARRTVQATPLSVTIDTSLEKDIAAARFLSSWARLETSARDLVRSAIGESAAESSSIVEVMKQAARVAGFDDISISDLDELRALRNRVVHPQPSTAAPDIESLDRASGKAVTLTRKLVRHTGG